MKSPNIGDQVYVAEGTEAFGAVRGVSRVEVTVYVEGGGDFVIPVTAVESVHDGKVILAYGKLDAPLHAAIRRAHRAETY